MTKRKIIIFANGEIKKPDQAQLFARAAEYIICADGGAIHCDRMGIIPDMIIGDMDSIPLEIREKFARHRVAMEIFPVHKDDTDLELAIHHARAQIRKRGEASIHIFGGLGGRWDMSLATVFLLANRDNCNQQIVLHGDRETFYALQPGEHRFLGAVGQRISFLPLQGDVKNVTLSGLRYPAKEISLKVGSCLGVSNRFIDNICVVTFTDGLLLMIIGPMENGGEG